MILFQYRYHFSCSKRPSPLALWHHTVRFSPFLPFSSVSSCWLLHLLPPDKYGHSPGSAFSTLLSLCKHCPLGNLFTVIVTSIITESETEFSSSPYHPFLHLILSHKFTVGHFFARPHLCLNITHYPSSIASPPKLPLTSANDDAHTAWFGNPDPIMPYCHTDIPKQTFLLDSELDKSTDLGGWIPFLTLSSVSSQAWSLISPSLHFCFCELGTCWIHGRMDMST